MEAQRNEAQEAIISTNKECDRKLAGTLRHFWV